MTEFYPGPDRYHWPIVINGANKFIRVIEDPGGANEATITTSVAESDVLIGDEPDYYAVGADDPAVPADAGGVVVLDDTADRLTARPLYNEIAQSLTNASSNFGSNNLTYEFTAITPSGSSQANSGIRLTTAGGSMDIQLDFSIADAIDPRLFGFGEGKSDTSPAGTTIDGPYSRWGSWQSPTGASHDKRLRARQRTFRSSPDPYNGKTWRDTRTDRRRDMKYIGVAGVHVWPDDRADRTAEADRGGLPLDDANNVLWDLWQYGAYGDRRLLVTVNQGDGDLSTALTSTGVLNVAKLRGEFADAFIPQDQNDRDHAGERYDLTVPLALADPDHYASAITPYRH